MTSNALLGFLDNKIKNEFENAEPWKINKVGGTAIFPNILTLDETSEIEELILCSKCNLKMILICQIYCPLELDKFGRIIFVFTCKNLKCEPSWSVFRFLFNENELINESINDASENQLFEETWSQDGNEIVEKKFKDNFENNVNMKLENYFVLKNLDKKIDPYFLVVEEEKFTKKSIKLNNHINELLKEYKAKKENGNNYKDSNNEDYNLNETDLLRNYNNDILTYKFYKKLFLYPHQIIRYNWNQQPLKNSSKIELDETLCENCYSKRIFEFQLMPGIINYLKLNNDENLNFNFATVLIYTCINNCAKKNFCKEGFIVLNETDTNLDFYK